MKKTTFFLLLCLLIALIIAAVSIGSTSIPIRAVWKVIWSKISGDEIPEVWQNYERTIWILRFPRVILSVLAGSALAICGAAFQSIFRNPICDPYILGISSGASLGAAIAIITGLNVFTFGIPSMALLSSLLTLLLVLSISRMKGNKSVEIILLAGIALNFLISAVITLLMVMHQESLEQIIFWTMGSFVYATWLENALLFLILLVCSFFLFLNSKNLNLMQLGNETAQTSGVNVQKTTLSVLILSSLLISFTVACCGVIGFIGLIIPHIVRLLFGNHNRTVFAFSLIFGALFCLIADTVARTVIAPAELPVGSITAIAGAPYFLYLLISQKSR